MRFGDLFVVRRDTIKTNRVHWICACDCGKTSIVQSASLVGGETRSCGCLRTRTINNYKHGCRTKGHKTGAYKSWLEMKTRCTNEKHQSYQRYGAKGIAICDRWLDHFENFLSDMGERPTGMSIDRIDSTRDYYPENCRWADVITQARNHTSTLLSCEKAANIRELYLNGTKQSQIARSFGVSNEVIYHVIKNHTWKT